MIDAEEVYKRFRRRLTWTQCHVVALVCQGMKNKEIAVKLRIPLHSVRDRLTEAFEELEIDSREKLMFMVLTKG